MSDCPFCAIYASPDQPLVVQSNASAFAIRDVHPVSVGHTLIMPIRHAASFFELSTEEQRDLLQLVNQQHALLKAEYHFADCNVGINDGPLAGQTVDHCHIHIIPRFEGDRADPRGGVRWVIPEKAPYWVL